MPVQRLLMHRAWVPLAVAITLVVAVATIVLRADTETVVFAGCYAPEVGPQAGAVPDGVFRWTRGMAAVKVPVRGRVLIAPVYLARPDLADGPIDVRVTLDGLHSTDVRFTANGWHVLAYDLAEIAGEAGWSRLDALTVTFHVSRTVRPSVIFGSDDHRDLGIGLGEPRWSERVPLGAMTPAAQRVPANR